jgi:hypothetical protein
MDPKLRSLSITTTFLLLSLTGLYTINLQLLLGSIVLGQTLVETPQPQNFNYPLTQTSISRIAKRTW